MLTFGEHKERLDDRYHKQVIRSYSEANELKLDDLFVVVLRSNTTIVKSVFDASYASIKDVPIPTFLWKVGIGKPYSLT